MLEYEPGFLVSKGKSRVWVAEWRELYATQAFVNPAMALACPSYQGSYSVT